ncbi:unnamed protein product [Adineta ricciae]|uniref:G-protein coupled receptors family 1 profile domain-containing protein n=1 Tax=Adineta ricciae TaxID=249248 RepID=A0A815NL52_ADIRI|nr:unnamed protein product [Adineta ricciae]CAF1431103.1 unnamed protein product [Adineta ricciae]
MAGIANETSDYDDGTGSYPVLESSFSKKFKFSFLLACLIPSTICSLTLFYYFIRLSELHRKRHNYVIICLLVCNFLIATTELPVTLTYIHFDQLVPPSSSLCFYWIFMNYLLFPTSGWIMAIASLQRYFFIFHKQFINTHLKHYLPIALPPILLFIWYTALIFFYPCQQFFDYTQLWCIGACYVFEGTIGTIDWILSSLVPVILTIVFNIVLCVRVVYQKYKMHRGRTWRTTRKLALQIFMISFLFLGIYLPLTLFGLIRLWFDPMFLLVLTMVYFAYIVYLVPLLMPFICLISMPEITAKIKRTLHPGTRIEPTLFQQLPLTMITRRHMQVQNARI